MVGVIGVMIPVVALVGAFILAIYLRKYQHAERLAMIEKGVGVELFDSMRPRSAFGRCGRHCCSSVLAWDF